MPATIFVRFDAPAPVPATPRRLHAALGHIFDLPAGVDPDRARTIASLAHRPTHDSGKLKPYSIGEMSQIGDMFVMEMRLLDDRLISTLDAWLAWGGVLPIGDGGPDTVHLAAVDAQITSKVTWEELAATAPAMSWEVDFVTPIVFSSRGSHLYGVTPAALATSLQQRWWSYDSASAPSKPNREEIEALFDWETDLQPVTLSLAKGRGDTRGRLASRSIEAYEGKMWIDALEAGAYAQEFSQLMALSRYTNAGSYTSYGLGVMVARAVEE
ncbi:CRISPR system precrRNA processing endoribonuclease RAMP protein Cas6 [Schaalia sp. Marseille-Q2122]|uniref:CRISPR system precrRNA processing endoribonuclease RAMP protein Cas6 n=1 Tax=Schaalia sp. Marseille-Q2122 TaxID=2736604 RepID=UPI0015886E9F|nr:CRISPR system precrRNA processing endoribonuclease RAMP protein Cas6 [Schaalia sp. Marseille-Q2122]